MSLLAGGEVDLVGAVGSLVGVGLAGAGAGGADTARAAVTRGGVLGGGAGAVALEGRLLAARASGLLGADALSATLLAASRSNHFDVWVGLL